MNGSITQLDEYEVDEIGQAELTPQREKDAVIVKPKPFYDFVKRAFDILVSLICLTVGLPVYLILILAIVIDDPGNPFFIQERTGLDGRVFRMIKLRTMYRESDEQKSELMTHNEYESVHFKMTNDPRVTRVGRFLRATSLDETTQAINMLMGDMTVVDPRPIMEDELQENYTPEQQELLLSVKPGLTGLWQVMSRNDCTYESGQRQKAELQYISEKGIWTDVKIMFKTVGTIFHQGGYTKQFRYFSEDETQENTYKVFPILCT